MLLNTVILILREVLEATLLISVLLAICEYLATPIKWLKFAIVFGTLGAIIFKINILNISSSFDFVGQEIANAFLQIIIFLMLTILIYLLNLQVTRKSLLLIKLCMLTIVSLAMIREGCEIIIYLSSFINKKDAFKSVLTGGFIGASIGLSIGILIYYQLIFLSKKNLLITCQLLLALISAAMISQSVQLLIQADWLPSQYPLWNTSFLINENSILGQILYSFVGYEATPTPIQVIAYFFALTVSLGLIFGHKYSTKTAKNA